MYATRRRTLLVVRQTSVSLGIALSLFASPCRASAQPPATTAPPDASPPQSSGVSTPTAEAASLVSEATVKAGRLTLRAQRAPLDYLLADISRQADIAIHGTGPLQGLTISMNLDDVPLEQGLRHLLGDLDAFFFYGSTAADKPASLQALWVYPKGKGARLAPIAAETSARTAELELALFDADPEVRAEAIEALVERRGDKSIDSVLQMLNDPDDYVRARALDVAASAHLEIPVDRLRALATDRGDDVRRVALRTLAEHSDVKPEDVRTLLETAAASDESEAIRSEAAQMLREMSEIARPRERPKP